MAVGTEAQTMQATNAVPETPVTRLHNVTSSANYSGRMNFDDLMGKQSYSRWGAYGQSKLANVFFTFELQKRLNAAGVDTITNTSHPGLVLGNLQANSVAQSGTSLEAVLYRIAQPFIAQDISMGVLCQLYGCTGIDAKGGVFYGPGGLTCVAILRKRRRTKQRMIRTRLSDSGKFPRNSLASPIHFHRET